MRNYPQPQGSTKHARNGPRHAPDRMINLREFNRIIKESIPTRTEFGGAGTETEVGAYLLASSGLMSKLERSLVHCVRVQEPAPPANKYSPPPHTRGGANTQKYNVSEFFICLFSVVSHLCQMS